MLESLTIRNYAIIDEMTAEFSSGLNIITGETGAGKSIVVDALELVLGARASSEMIRAGAASLDVSGVFTPKTALEENILPFRVDEEAEIVYGSGVCDMKGGCVILLDALGMALKEAAAVRDASLTVLLDCCEELSTPSFAEVARETARDATACLNFEPPGVTPDGEAQIVIGRKGVLRFDLTCSGRAAHSGNAHANGINAIRELARKVEQIESLTDYDAGLSANVGQIVGGHAANQVADKASMTFELRAFEAEALERLRAEARTICSRSTVRSSEDGATTRLELQEHFSYPAWPTDKGTECLAKRYVELAKKHGVVVTPVQRGGGSDASHVADLVPTLDGLGILGGGMHAKTEWADLKSLAVGGRIVADLIADLCSNGCDCT